MEYNNNLAKNKSLLHSGRENNFGGVLFFAFVQYSRYFDDIIITIYIDRGKVGRNVTNEAILSSDRVFTSFMFNGHNIRFRTSPRLERYTKVIEWDNGYIVVMAKYEGCDEEEEYIDLVPILENLYFDVDDFLKPIQKVRIEYV